MIHIKKHGPVTGFRLARTLLGRGRYYTACFHVDGLMVDSGCQHTVPELLAALEPLPVHTVVATHSHEDHVAGNEPLQRLRGAKVYAHALALPILRGEAPRPPLMPYQKVLWGWPATCQAQEAPGVIETEHHRFDVLHTPGHWPDHVCLHEPHEGWLFCGDAYVGGRDRGLRAGYDVWGIIASMKKMAALDIARLFCGSGSVVDNPAQELADKIAYLEEIGQRVLELHGQGWPVKRIRKKLLGGRQQIDYLTQLDFSGENMVRSYLSDSPWRPPSSD
ncbi:MAG: MBL fold metallo-hydrolase [Desulfarculus sp.]|nr:MBL fold metallo-hydrolase [Desulfarculus sp.]